MSEMKSENIKEEIVIDPVCGIDVKSPSMFFFEILFSPMISAETSLSSVSNIGNSLRLRNIKF